MSLLSAPKILACCSLITKAGAIGEMIGKHWLNTGEQMIISKVADGDVDFERIDLPEASLNPGSENIPIAVPAQPNN